MHNAFPARGTEEWYAMVEQLVAEHDTDVKRLWDRTPQNPDNIGDAAQDPNWEPPSSS